MKRMNDLERYLLGQLTSLPMFQKYAKELLIELISQGSVRDRSEDEINKICEDLYNSLIELDETEKNTRQDFN